MCFIFFIFLGGLRALPSSCCPRCPRSHAPVQHAQEAVYGSDPQRPERLHSGHQTSDRAEQSKATTKHEGKRQDMHKISVSPPTLSLLFAQQSIE